MKRGMMTCCVLTLLSMLGACASVTTQEGDATKHSFLDGLFSFRVRDDGTGAGGLISTVLHASARTKNKLIFVTQAEEQIAQRTLSDGDYLWVEWQNEEIGRMRIRPLGEAREYTQKTCREYTIEFWDKNRVSYYQQNALWNRVGHGVGCKGADGAWRVDRMSGVE